MWHHAGIGRYLRELVRQPAYRALNAAFDFYGYAQHAEEIQNALPNAASRFIPIRSKIYSLAEQLEWLSLGPMDLLHVPHFNVPVFLNRRLVATIHDLTYLHQKDASSSGWAAPYTRFMLECIQKKASAVLTVSEHTRKDFLELFPRHDSRRMTVTPEAPAALFQRCGDRSALERTRERFQLCRPFVLFVGSLKPHKNVPAAIRALERLRSSKGIAHEFVLVGRVDPRNRELLSLTEKSAFVRTLGEIDDTALMHLYNLADLFVLPSFYEGFGLPVLEAMACGAPVIASNRSSLPEIMGDAGILFDPYRVDALEALIYNVLKNNELRENMRRNGLEQAKRFSWRKTAEATVRVYESVLSSKD
jgi:glycosyltransferase involved in cell wall biosynthesis